METKWKDVTTILIFLIIGTILALIFVFYAYSPELMWIYIVCICGACSLRGKGKLYKK